jgi:hypothetical protein
MADQKPMTTANVRQPAPNPDQVAKDRERRAEEASKKLNTDPAIADRIRAAHPHMQESDDALKAAMEDFDRLVSQKNGGAKGVSSSG